MINAEKGDREKRGNLEKREKRIEIETCEPRERESRENEMLTRRPAGCR